VGKRSPFIFVAVILVEFRAAAEIQKILLFVKKNTGTAEHAAAVRNARACCGRIFSVKVSIGTKKTENFTKVFVFIWFRLKVQPSLFVSAESRLCGSFVLTHASSPAEVVFG
jgi:hypothetical protein